MAKAAGDMTVDDVLALKRENRKLKEHLRDLVRAVGSGIELIDAEMRKPSTVERGKRIAAVLNGLEMQHDLASHFGLGRPLRKPAKTVSAP